MPSPAPAAHREARTWPDRAGAQTVALRQRRRTPPRGTRPAGPWLVCGAVRDWGFAAGGAPAREVANLRTCDDLLFDCPVSASRAKKKLVSFEKYGFQPMGSALPADTAASGTPVSIYTASIDRMAAPRSAAARLPARQSSSPATIV